MFSDFFNQLLTTRQELLDPPHNRQLSQPTRYYIHDKKRILSGQMMRVNYIGEVCAQALYIGQIKMAQDSKLKQSLRQAKIEEVDHLVWCHNALRHLYTTTSTFTYGWFIGALIMSTCISLLGDDYSASFLEETEQQVARHLNNHLSLIPLSDQSSIAILQQMLKEELQHADTAHQYTDQQLPWLITLWMQLNGRLMTYLGRYC